MARAIEQLKQAMEVCELGALTLPDQIDALMDAARAILQEVSTPTPPNEPLMWEEFESMIDKPVYIIELETRSYWALVQQVSDVGVMLTSAIDLHDYGARELYGKTWIAYHRPPEGEEDT